MDRYTHLSRKFRGASGSVNFVTTDSGNVVLTAAKSTDYTIFIERIDVTIKTDAAQTITFQDTAASPTFVEATDASPGANTKYVWEFPGGRPLAEGKNFIMTFSAAGLAGHVQWQGHQRKTA